MAVHINSDNKNHALVADVPVPAEFIKKTLAGHYADVDCVHTFKQALDALTKKQYSLIVSGVHFDDCRMMELLWRVKEMPQYKEVPFLCVRALPAHHEINDSVMKTHEALGAVGFVEIEDMGDASAVRLLEALQILEASAR